MDEARQERPHDLHPGPDGLFPCPYLGCSDATETARGRISHMMKAHRIETEARLSAIEELLGGDWRTRARCRGGGDAWIAEPTSRDKKEARRTGERHVTKSERSAIAICLDCPVRRSCARSSLQPPPRHPELPRDPIDYEPYGIWAGVPSDARKQLVKEFGTGAEALEMVLQLGERFAGEYPPNVRRGAHGR